MFLFIFESIGTSELILIGIIALVVFGPRKLPQFARTIGKTMAEFRRTTNEFKETWEKEVNFEEEEKLLRNEESLLTEKKSISRDLDLNKNLIATPEIKEISQGDFEQFGKPDEIKESVSASNEKNSGIESSDAANNSESENSLPGKRDWL